MRSTQRSLLRFMRLALGIPLLMAACIGSLTAIYGSAPGARLEASRLAQAELAEIAGTDDYNAATGRTMPWQTWVTQLPLAEPARLLSSELPIPSVWDTTSSGQTGLAASLYVWEKQSSKIVLGWAPYDTAQHTVSMMEQMPGLTVLSPKWLSVQDAGGDVQSHIEDAVITAAHDKHIAVWALVDNQFSASLTHAVLSSPTARENLVRHLTDLATQHHLDGINVDFENVRTADRDNFTRFIHDLHAALAPKHIALSVDITPDIVFLRDEAAFFHAGLAADCDYVVLMAYDEHWAGDQEPGPVADVPWVTQSVSDLLNTGVPADHLILGLPFYTRFWYVHRDGSVESEAVKASSVESILRSHGASSQWNDSLGVMYARYPKEDGYMEVWYETGQTLARKLQLVSDNGLAGVAIWSLSLADRETWSTMMDGLRNALN